MRHFLTRATLATIRHVFRAVVYGAIGMGLAGLIMFVVHLESRPDLEIWHTAKLDQEFTVDSPVTTFAGYLALEDRLFAELNRKVYDKVSAPETGSIKRYHRGSHSDPARWPKNWNRSYELAHGEPRIGVLLIHGMSDSPYSLRSIGEALHRNGAWVTALRVPGHGTAPAGLLRTDWQDMAAAVNLAFVHLAQRLPKTPLYIVGYSNGAALAVNYALTTLEDPALPAPVGLVLLSPEIGVTGLAALAVWQQRLGVALGLDKLAWNSLQPEYDPFKYGSFALNAGKQAHELTTHIQSRISALSKGALVEDLPPILAFQSVIDATVSAPAVVSGLFARIPDDDHELVLFDINRDANVEALLSADPSAWIRTMLEDDTLGYNVQLVTNAGVPGAGLVARNVRPGAESAGECRVAADWPPSVYSLSHVALPFPPDDPLYGGPDALASPGVELGNLALRGERGALRVSPADLLRLRWNPFYDYMLERMLGFTGLADTSPACD